MYAHIKLNQYKKLIDILIVIHDNLDMNFYFLDPCAYVIVKFSLHDYNYDYDYFCNIFLTDYDYDYVIDYVINVVIDYIIDTITHLCSDPTKFDFFWSAFYF